MLRMPSGGTAVGDEKFIYKIQLFCFCGHVLRGLRGHAAVIFNVKARRAGYANSSMVGVQAFFPFNIFKFPCGRFSI